MNIIDYINDSYRKNSNAASYKKLILKIQVSELLYKQGNKSISELCELTNNSIPSMTAMLNELVEAGWIINYGIGESKGGRKPAIYGLNPEAGYIVGVEIGRRKIRMCIFDLYNQKVGDVIEINNGLDTNNEVLNIIKSEVSKLLKANKLNNHQVIGCGVTIPGLIDIKKGLSYSYPQFESQNLNQLFSKTLGRPSFVEHDTKSMVLGESWFGQARNMANAIFLNIGSAIGSGMILNGQLYHGHSGFSGEFGHIQINPEGDLCYCGKVGCLETVASGAAIIKRAIAEIEKGKNTLINKRTNGDLSYLNLEIIINSAKQGDQYALELLEHASEYLAKATSTLLHLLNPDIIIIGGEMAKAGSLFLNLLNHKLNKYTMLQIRRDSNIVLSEISDEAGLLGTIPVVMSRVLNVSREIE